MKHVARIVKSLLLAASLGLTACGATVKPGQRGLKYYPLSSPGLQKDVKAEGFWWLWPWNGMVTYDVVWTTAVEKVEILTADDLHVSTEVSVTYRPIEAGLYRLHLEIGPDYYQQVIKPSFVTIARTEFARHGHNDLARDARAIELAVLEQLRHAVASKPIEIDQVTVRHIEYDRSVSAAISRKLATVQQVAQKDAEVRIAERDAEIARAHARGRADAVRIEAEAEAAALVLKGDGQAKAQAAITRTLSPSYLRYKAFDGDATRYYFVPVGRDGLPLIVDTGASSAQPRPPLAARE